MRAILLLPAALVVVYWLVPVLMEWRHQRRLSWELAALLVMHVCALLCIWQFFYAR